MITGLKSKMGSSERDELVDQVIQKVLTEIEKIDRLESSGDEDDQRQLLLSSLLSELESIKSNGGRAQPGALSKQEKGEGEVNSGRELGKVDLKENGKTGGEDKTSNGTVGMEEIVKELRVVKRQNVVTHCLVSVMIVLTVAWQLSEVSFILKVKDGLSHPFKSFGSILSVVLGGQGIGNPQVADKELSSSKNQPIMVPPVPPVKLPELPHVELGFNGGNHS